MKPLILTLAGFLLAFFAVEVKASRYRGGTVSYKPGQNSPYSVTFTYRLSFRRGAVYCDGSRVANRQLASTSFPSRWQVTRYWNGGYYSSSSSGSANIYCTDFNVHEDWSEGNNSFLFTGGNSDESWIVKITDSGNWISGITYSNPNNITLLNARVNTTVSGVFNNSSPVSSLPLTVYVEKGISSVIRIPVEDPDGDVVRCRKATYQECYRGMCTYFPYGVLDEASCTLSYDGSGSVGQLLPIILKLEDFPSGTTQFGSSNRLGSVDLQFVLHIKPSSSVANATNCWQTSVSIHYTVGPSTTTVTQTDAENVMKEVLNHGTRQLSCSGLTLKLLAVTITTPGNLYVITGKFGVVYGNMNSTQKQTARSCLMKAVVFNDIILRPDYYTSPLKGHFADRASLTNYQDTCCSNGTCGVGTTSSPGVGTTSSPGGGTTSSPGGGTTSSPGGGTTSSPGVGTTQANLKTSVTCGENFLQIDLKDQYFSGVDYRSLHLKNTSCKATKTSYTMRLRTPLDGCGTTYVEHDKKIVFWNEVRNEKGWFGVGNVSAITRYENLVIPFYCEYGREKIVSTNFNPSKKTVYASDGSHGNFTFVMDLYQTSRYSTPYSVFAYPVVVYPNQPLWVQYEVKNTNADLVVFAENCRATTTTNPDSYPQHVFLERGCVRDSTMIYSHNPYSRVQRFSIRSFRFVYSNTFLVYLHCELLVCHRNTTNSRCTRGCISSRGRRETDDMDSSQLYDLSAGPLKGPNTKTGNDKNSGTESSQSTTVTIGVVSGLAVVALLLATLLAVKMLYNRHNTPVVPNKVTSPPAIDMHQTVNSYEQHVMKDDEQVEIEI